MFIQIHPQMFASIIVMSEMEAMLLPSKVVGISMEFLLLVPAPILASATSPEKQEVVQELPLEARCQVVYPKSELRASAL
jgi:hypothetical protein